MTMIMQQYAYSFIILVHFITLFQIPAAGFQRSLSQYLSHNGNNIIPKLNKNSHGTKYFAKPERLEDNVDGILYVNDHCINCAACSYFAPETFQRSSTTLHHIVHHQPPNEESSIEFQNARTALAACPVSAIRALTRGEISHHNKIISGQNNTILLPQLTPDEERMTKKYGILNKPLSFPKVLSDNVWFLGHHSSKSFGAFPYLVHGYHKQQLVSIMIDVPKYTKSAISAVSSILPKDAKEVDYLFLTHVDDSAQHDEWKREFSSMKRIFHSGDLGENNWVGDETLEDVEILLDGKSIVEDKDLLAYSLDGEIFRIDFNQDDVSVCSKLENVMKEIDTEFLILHTPGHSPGSISLLYKSQENNIQNGTIFTGDTYAYTTRNGGYMTGFPNYGNNLVQQAVTLKCLGQISKLYECVASGHGHVRDYRKIVSVSDVNNDTGINVEADTLKSKDISDAINELIQFRR